MKINNTSNIIAISSYKANKIKQEKTEEMKQQDSCEISDLGKTLNNFSNEEFSGVSKEKIEAIREKISQGTYKVDSKLVAEKLIEHMKGREY
ncbi:flagellar biosynthesis anti-sigma factor FlgM [uncultured Clostridium sp.]|uniref:flagellar biosynthesis anti-sigma factor FlgM n=1 Tax=uncultured Clostridium sp. TaxID=59620 RepID=UPI0025869E3A|nr:flagellar biosynthesis anti-sigma factor FlgM [uncultured Clostridium sp.]MDU1349516.1 flagellar biosynthesis anti-sigma factor FlgM [Clostridium argentinense]